MDEAKQAINNILVRSAEGMPEDEIIGILKLFLDKYTVQKTELMRANVYNGIALLVLKWELEKKTPKQIMHELEQTELGRKLLDLSDKIQ